MRPMVAVDATPIISALLGGFSREILFNHYFHFVTTQFTITEVEKYILYIAEKAGVAEKTVKSLFYLLPLEVNAKSEYKAFLSTASSLIKDQKDIDILALALAKNCPLWSEDKGFDSVTAVKIIKTKDFV